MADKVLLTGISGWIAKHTAIELLNSGYEVLGTFRNNTLIEQTKETISEHAPIDNLSFVELDLLKDDGWNEAAQGCKYVMHIASPFPYKVSNNRDSLLAPAVDGTLRVLNAGINDNGPIVDLWRSYGIQTYQCAPSWDKRELKPEAIEILESNKANPKRWC